MGTRMHWCASANLLIVHLWPSTLLILVSLLTKVKCEPRKLPKTFTQYTISDTVNTLARRHSQDRLYKEVPFLAVLNVWLSSSSHL